VVPPAGSTYTGAVTRDEAYPTFTYRPAGTRTASAPRRTRRSAITSGDVATHPRAHLYTTYVLPEGVERIVRTLANERPDTLRHGLVGLGPALYPTPVE
jgi:hypothetical protein